MKNGLKTRLLAGYNDRRVAFGALVVAIIIFFTVMTQVMHSWQAIMQPTINDTAEISQAAVISAPISQIPNWHLMGGGGIGQLPTTGLALTLHGVLMSSDPKQSLAIISLPGQNEKLYKVGDSLPNGALLYEILEDSVVIKNQDQLEQLPLSRPKLTIAPPPQSSWR